MDLSFVLRRAARPLLDLPEPAISWLATALEGPPPMNRRGVVLDREAHLLLAAMRRVRVRPFVETPLGVARREFREGCQLIGPTPLSLPHVTDWQIPGPVMPIRVRSYRPEEGPLPALVFFHGGGCVLGDLDSHDSICRRLALGARCQVVSVDYRLAPEHPFPGAVVDSVAAFRWISLHAKELQIDPARLAVGGDSAGGCLAAVVAQQLRNTATPATFQLLLYPVTDLRGLTGSYEEFREGFYLTWEDIDWFVERYMAGHSRLDPRASPLLADNLSDLPPALIVTAGFDPLRDEGEEYATRLRAAKVPVELVEAEALLHGFFGMTAVIGRAEKALTDTAEALGLALA